MKKDYDNKMLTTETEAVEAPAETRQPKKRKYHFAGEGVTVEATTLKEAEEQLAEIIKNKK